EHLGAEVPEVADPDLVLAAHRNVAGAVLELAVTRPAVAAPRGDTVEVVHESPEARTARVRIECLDEAVLSVGDERELGARVDGETAHVEGGRYPSWRGDLLDREAARRRPRILQATRVVDVDTVM